MQPGAVKLVSHCDVTVCTFDWAWSQKHTAQTLSDGGPLPKQDSSRSLASTALANRRWRHILVDLAAQSAVPTLLWTCISEPISPHQIHCTVFEWLARGSDFLFDACAKYTCDALLLCVDGSSYPLDSRKHTAVHTYAILMVCSDITTTAQADYQRSNTHILQLTCCFDKWHSVGVTLTATVSSEILGVRHQTFHLWEELHNWIIVDSVAGCA